MIDDSPEEYNPAEGSGADPQGTPPPGPAPGYPAPQEDPGMSYAGYSLEELAGIEEEEETEAQATADAGAGMDMDLSAPEPEPEPPPPPAPEPTPARVPLADVLQLTPEMVTSEIISAPTVTAATDILADLARAILDRRDIAVDEAGRNMTLEGMVREMLKPMLREWLDRNLPYLIERLVKKEIDTMINRAEGLSD